MYFWQIILDSIIKMYYYTVYHRFTLSFYEYLNNYIWNGLPKRSKVIYCITFSADYSR